MKSPSDIEALFESSISSAKNDADYRRRRTELLAHPAGKKHKAEAEKLAWDTSISVDEAIKRLEATPTAREAESAASAIVEDFKTFTNKSKRR